MCFGFYALGPKTFSCLMDIIMTSLSWKIWLVFLDSIMVFSGTMRISFTK